jgi:hypothetical protein
MAKEDYPKIVLGLKRAGKFFISSLQDELKEQEHYASGDLYRSFDVEINEFFGSLFLDVVSSVSYMNIVNEGDTNGVIVDESTIIRWLSQKGISSNMSALEAERYAENIVAQLQSNYLTEGGEMVAPRRYNFIGYAFAKAEGSGIIDAIEEDIAQSIEAEIGSVFSGKVIQLKIA